MVCLIDRLSMLYIFHGNRNNIPGLFLYLKRDPLAFVETTLKKVGSRCVSEVLTGVVHFYGGSECNADAENLQDMLLRTLNPGEDYSASCKNVLTKETILI
ncbi:hypothetical protein FRX31_022758 [Thalictrum thalictroides]|uniref:Uncharacterized protein n=1 Tax=Thalictrum thalictroides TaxID=46969 RepID=A0A7J6VU15_THATH|nr:hypothetical protein FRX31_022758 [Thalictrum thalictroides]